MKFLALKLEGPLQSWGFDSQYKIRQTSLFPSKSAIAGMCCAALGYDRGSQQEKLFLDKFTLLKMTAIKLDFYISNSNQGKKHQVQLTRLRDYHIVQNTRKASGGLKDSHPTNRFYLNDAKFGVILEGSENIIHQLATALVNPVWGLWLGRKACIPSSPIFQGIFNTFEDALEKLTNERNLSTLTYQQDIDQFSDGKDTIPDVAQSFLSNHREFNVRRLTTVYADRK
jgi:CRISPR system Cascade subunit CasD